MLGVFGEEVLDGGDGEGAIGSGDEDGSWHCVVKGRSRDGDREVGG